jgi:predicted permease
MPSRRFSLIRRLASQFRRERLDEQLREEIDLHIELRERALVGEGMSPRDAAYEARRRFGNLLKIREQARDIRAFPAVDSLLQDLRLGLRRMRRAPAFAAAAIVPLALGIGAATAVFAIVEAVLLRTLPVRDPAALFEYRAEAPVIRKELDLLSPAVFEEVRRFVDYAHPAGFRSLPEADLAAGGLETRPAAVELVTDGYFEVVGALPLAGRMLDAQDAPATAVLSEHLWRTRLGADPTILGRVVTINGARVAVVGIVRGFRGLVVERPADVFLPVRVAELLDSAAHGSSPGNLQVVMRLNPGVAPDDAARRLSALCTEIAPLAPVRVPIVVTLRSAARGVSELRGPFTTPLLLLLGLVIMLLTIACANVANLMLSRVAARRAEFALRAAIGAGRRRIVQQVFVEALLLSSAGAALGAVLAAFAGPVLVRLVPRATGADRIVLGADPVVVFFAAGAALAAALVVTAACGFRLRRPDATDALATHLRPAGRRSRLGDLLIVVQVACSLLLVAGSGSMLQTVRNLARVDAGLTLDDRFFVSVTAPHTVTDHFRYFAYLRDAVAAAPLVSHASVVQFPLMGRGQTTGSIDVPGFTPAAPDDRFVRFFQVGPDFFEATGMPLLHGRGIDVSDVAASPKVAVVNEAFARFYFGRDDVVDRVFANGTRIVGVVRDARYDGLREHTSRAVFVPYQQSRSRPSMTLVVHGAGDPAAAMASAATVIRTLGGGARFEAVSARDQVEATVWRERFVAALSAALAMLAALLVCGGVYAVVACSAVERRHEIGVRIALGARRAQVVALVIGRPLSTALVGLAAGLPGTWIVMRALRSLLFGIGAFDPATLVLAAVGIVGITVAAALVPALRAASMDPREAIACA